jgi:hypothetical protein
MEIKLKAMKLVGPVTDHEVARSLNVFFVT